ncbi:hypothetical protein PHYBLDRAFT_170462 [Phycomyces blakesleeanus NRRL 1555(-)]|uniref:CCHC-type zinc finger transcription factor n=1 Tax=Phycomyces blakesleeanus (strain ATCC 8743b / DSM 1359 / FGSC 10004 / NBRC 33097 / NRRL 1555) TaxID=763407 RepID=A0A162PPY4_PHYB8|nr:hypothetical protein PHYBLDRAFT_170462 [Phycomyces blakesleeanus NRRL 1555(-)]OAD71816.1 hypothetical protein PHYBLDRAFT_170462 [Phycomyces blakesleeanus NRRL 1555(-)]|eukprot:XP_018289856.1 hypothetical protein PHYBLDRAFT_170462 [Phycomyces blakesleeanus NRRL 1555(-)]
MSTPEGLNPQDRAHTLRQGNPPNRAQSTTLRPKNKSLHIFTAPNFDKNMIVDLASAAWASTIHPISVLFNLGKLVPTRDVDDVLSDRVGRMTSLTLRYTRSKDLLAEAFFTDPSSRTKATSDGLTYQNTRIIAIPRLPSNSHIVKVNLYRINACDPSTDLLEPIENAFRPFGKIVQLRAYLSHRGTFRGEATIYLDTSGQDEVRSLPSHLHLGGSLSCLAELCSTDITPVCGYCREEGHYLHSCTKRPPRAPRCQRCGVLGHAIDSRKCPTHPDNIEAERAIQEQQQIALADTASLRAHQYSVAMIETPIPPVTSSTLTPTHASPILNPPATYTIRCRSISVMNTRAMTTRNRTPHNGNPPISFDTTMYDPTGRGLNASKHSPGARGLHSRDDGINPAIYTDDELRQSLFEATLQTRAQGAFPYTDLDGNTPMTDGTEKSDRSGTLNVRGLLSTINNPQSPKLLFIRHLHTLSPSLSLLALRETHLLPIHHSSIHLTFQAQASLWTPHCGLVSFDPLLQLSQLHVSPDNRALVVKVTHTDHRVNPFVVVVIYAPNIPSHRHTFFSSLARTLPTVIPSLPTFILGDFNCDLSHRRSHPPDWKGYIQGNCVDAITNSSSPPLPTFHSSRTHTRIDYIFRPHSIVTKRPELRNHCTLLSQRCLSVRGKSIVANSLLLSSVWHMLYVTPAPLSFFAAIHTHIRSFLRLGFGSPGWPLLCLPHKSGGLGLIDPDHQQRALQLRWILPILHSHSFSSTSFILPYLEFILPLNFRAPSASIALLFPCSSATCPTSLLPLHRACTSLLPASLPSNLQLPPTVVQHFPLTSIWMNVPPFVDSSLNLKTILVSDAFSLETDDRLVRKVRGTFSWARNRIGHFFQQIDSGRMVLCPWFISCLEHRPSTDTPSPNLSSLLSLSGGKCFGIECQPENVSIYLYLDASPAHLASFVKMLLKISITFSLAVLSNGRCGMSFSLAFARPRTLLKSAFSLPEAASHHVPPIKAFGLSFLLSLLKRFGVLIGNLFLMTNPFCQALWHKKRPL